MAQFNLGALDKNGGVSAIQDSSKANKSASRCEGFKAFAQTQWPSGEEDSGAAQRVGGRVNARMKAQGDQCGSAHRFSPQSGHTASLGRQAKPQQRRVKG
jgi:hypothetical protein